MVSQRATVLFLVFTSIFVYNAAGLLEIQSPLQLKGVYKSVGHVIGSVEENWDKQNITLVRSEFHDVAGKAVIIESDLNDFEEDAVSLQREGATLIVYVVRSNLNLGLVSYLLRYPQKSKGLNIPVVTTYKDTFDPALLNNTETAFGTVYPDFNSFLHVFNHWGYYLTIFLLISYTTFCFGVAVCILWQHIFFRSKTNTFLTIPVVCLAFEAIANFLRILFLVDPFQGLHIYPHLLQQALTSASVPFSLASALLVTMYWHESIYNKAVKVAPFLQRTKIAFICIIVALYMFFILSSMSTTIFSDGLSTAFTVINWTIILGSIGVIVVYGLIVCRTLIVFSKDTTIKVHRLNMMRIRLYTFCTLQVLFFFSVIGVAAVISLKAEAGWFATVVMIYIFILDTLSLVQSIPLWMANRRRVRTSKYTNHGTGRAASLSTVRATKSICTTPAKMCVQTTPNTKQ